MHVCVKRFSERLSGADQLLVDRPLPEGIIIVELTAQFNYSPCPFFRLGGCLVKIRQMKKLPDKVSPCSDYIREVP